MNNNENLFYIRYLQWKFYFSNNQYVKAIFFLENFLFDNFNKSEETMILNLKLKWIYDQIANGDFSNNISKNLITLHNAANKNEILDLIEYYSNSVIDMDEGNLFDFFKVFNSKLNSLLKINKLEVLRTSALFQKLQFTYKNNLDIDKASVKKEYANLSDLNLDIFEIVFIELFLKTKKLQKISKTFFLIKLLIKFIKK